MLNPEEQEFVYQNAYLPEHLPHYVMGISAGEPFLHMDCLCYRTDRQLSFVGFPLSRESKADLALCYESACERFGPSTVSLIAPKIWLPPGTYEAQAPDHYYVLDLPLREVDPELHYMLRRARRESVVVRGTFGREHRRLIKGFLKTHPVSRIHREVFQRIPNYLKAAPSAHLFEVRKGKDLVAFTIVDMGSADYAFYLFSFRSPSKGIPGASDLLFYTMVQEAESLGKRCINLGLGINPGIRRFKEKWGGRPFLPHDSAIVQRRHGKIDALVQKL